MRSFTGTIGTCVTVVAMLAMAAPAFGRASPQQHAEFNRLVSERNELYGQLEAHDREAARQIKQGENPLELHSRQVTIQDQLDLVELRLDMLSLRHDLPVPPLPGHGDDADEASNNDDNAQRSEAVFARGRDRAVGHLRRDLQQMLARIDFQPFLQQTDRASRAEGRSRAQAESRRPESRIRHRGMMR